MMDVYQFYDTLDDVIFSILCIAAAVYLVNLARLIQSKVLSYTGFNSSSYNDAFIEMLGTMETCVIGFELNFIIHDVYGTPVYAMAVFLALLWHDRRFKRFDYYANPAVLAMKHVHVIRGGMSIGDFGNYFYLAKLIAGELAGAALAYYFIVYVAWANAHYFTLWRSSNYHMSRYSSHNSWKTSMRTTIPFGMVVEGGFSFLNYLVPQLVYAHTSFRGDAALLAVSALRALCAGIGADYTGAYYNPIVPTALEWRQTKYWPFWQVYWLAPCIGLIAANTLF